MNQKVIKKVIWGVFVISASCLISMIHMRVYFDVLAQPEPENYIIRCKDYGQYLSEVDDYYKDNLNLLDTMEVDKEPGLFLITSTWQRISNTSDRAALIIISLLINTLCIIGAYIIALRATKSKAAGLTTIIIIGSAYLNNSALDSLLTRQLLGNMFLLMPGMAFILYKKGIGGAAVMGIFLAMCACSHRISLMFEVFTVTTIIFIFFLKKDRHSLRKILLGSIFAGLFCAPYLFIFGQNAWDTILHYIIKYWSVMNGIADYNDASSIDLSPGISLYTGQRPTHDVAMGEYISYEGYMVVLLVCCLRGAPVFLRTKKSFYFLYSLFVITTLYVCTNFIFSTRILITFNIIFLSLFVRGASKSFGKNIRFVLIVLLSIIGLISVAGKTITNEVGGPARIKNIGNDSSVDFLKNNINAGKSFLIGSHCANEFGAQIGYKTALNFSQLTIWKENLQKQNGEFSFGQYSGMIGQMRNGIFEKPYVSENFKGTDLYVIFGPYMSSQSELLEIKKRSSFYFGQPYISLIYESNNPSSYIRYIFKIDSEKLNYFDVGNYFSKNLIP